MDDVGRKPNGKGRGLRIKEKANKGLRRSIQRSEGKAVKISVVEAKRRKCLDKKLATNATKRS